jgi:hypothetical protein
VTTAARRAADAEKQRRFRERRKSGLRGFKLYLPARKLEKAVRARNGLPPDKPVSQEIIERLLHRCAHEWADSWIVFRRHRR